MIRELLVLPVRVALLPLRLARRIARRALGRPSRPASPAGPAPTPRAHEPERDEPEEPAHEHEDVEVTAAVALGWLAEGQPLVIVDVREPEELARTGIVEGARHLPLGQLPRRAGELAGDQRVVVYCASGGRSHGAAHYLREHGCKDAWSVIGGLSSWMQAGGKVIPAA